MRARLDVQSEDRPTTEQGTPTRRNFAAQNMMENEQEQQKVNSGVKKGGFLQSIAGNSQPFSPSKPSAKMEIGLQESLGEIGVESRR